jgi:hypothetical protein
MAQHLMFLTFVVDVIYKYGLGIVTSLSLLAVIMAIAAYKFRVELLVFIRSKYPFPYVMV